jgi:glycosyltransferase involved in cell wall biosynthesis
MITLERYYDDLTSVRIQRQVTKDQFSFFSFLKNTLSDEQHLIYDIDDVFIYEDIPGYNKFRSAYRDPELKEYGLRMMRESNEVTVTCDYMKQYYSQYMDNITVIPNYLPRLWLDRFYDIDLLAKNYSLHVKKKKKPRILYAASGAHFDVDGRNKYIDDFAHLVEVVRKTYNDYQWVFLGGFPPPLADLMNSNSIEFHPWSPIPDYPRFIHKLNVNLTIAPLLDNTFNRCKSDLKLIESAAFGIPCICQDMITYSDALYKFDTGDTLIDNIKNILRDKNTYLKACRKTREIADARWLEDHIEEYVELYKYPKGSSMRKQLNLLQVDSTI